MTIMVQVTLIYHDDVSDTLCAECFPMTIMMWVILCAECFPYNHHDVGDVFPL